MRLGIGLPGVQFHVGINVNAVRVGKAASAFEGIDTRNIKVFTHLTVSELKGAALECGLIDCCSLQGSKVQSMSITIMAGQHRARMLKSSVLTCV